MHTHTVCVWVSWLLCWPLAWLLTAALTRFSTMNVKHWDKWDISFRENSFGLLCMQTLQWNTQCSYNLTHTEHWGYCQSSSNHSPRVLPTVGKRATMNNRKKFHLCDTKLFVLLSIITIKQICCNLTYYHHYGVTWCKSEKQGKGYAKCNKTCFNFLTINIQKHKRDTTINIQENQMKQRVFVDIIYHKTQKI